MYYEQQSDKYQDYPEYWYKQRSRYDLPERTEATAHCVSRLKRVYSFRTKRPKNDSSKAIVPGESLIGNNRAAKRGSYLDSYKAAIHALDDEAGQRSVDSGYGAFDKGHSFASLHTRATTASLKGMSSFTYESDSGVQVIERPFVSVVNVRPRPVYYKPGQVGRFPVEVRNTIQELAVSTVPDKITGSLGQDIVDLAELPRLIQRLSSLGRDMLRLRDKWQQLSVKVRHAIDVCIRDRSRAPKWALRTAGSGYLEWLFVLEPYIEDMKAISKFLSKTSRDSLRRYSATKNRVALKTTERPHGGAYDGGCRWLTYKFTEENEFSVHLAICWVHRGPLPSDETFAKKAKAMNKELGLWYPSLMWDLMPWTWLIDWCTHIGASINGAYAISNSNYRPAYAWATVRNTVRYIGQFVPFKREDIWLETNYVGAEGVSLCRYPVQLTGVVQPKFSSLSSSQKAILGALGLSHIK